MDMIQCEETDTVKDRSIQNEEVAHSLDRDLWSNEYHSTDLQILATETRFQTAVKHDSIDPVQIQTPVHSLYSTPLTRSLDHVRRAVLHS